MRIGSRSGHLVLASVFALAPVLAVADKARPKAGPTPPTEAELKKIVAKAFNPVEAVAAQGSGNQKLTIVRDWKVKTEGSPQLVSLIHVKVEFKVSNNGPTPLPSTMLSYSCQVKLSPSPAPWIPRQCPGGFEVAVPALQPGEHKVLSGFAYRTGYGPPGSYVGYVYHSKITATVDRINAVAEWSENNNSAGWTWE